MAKVSRTEIFEAPINQVYDVIVDYAAYPEYVDGVTGLEVLDESETGARVEYSLNLIKKFKYILKLKHQRPTHVAWSFESGDIFKKNDGSWTLKDLGGERTEVTYSLDVDVKGFVPGPIISALTEKNLPAMMRAFHDRAKEV
jgi:ribosome-associated toxin RatA of RatAB toxin-antitoxin module